MVDSKSYQNVDHEGLVVIWSPFVFAVHGFWVVITIAGLISVYLTALIQSLLQQLLLSAFYHTGVDSLYIYTHSEASISSSPDTWLTTHFLFSSSVYLG
jgi:hypothetical protein